MARKAVVIGAVGFVGSRITRILLEQGYDVVAFGRDLRPARKAFVESVDTDSKPVWIEGDRNDPKTMSLLMSSRPDVWFDMATHSATAAAALLGVVGQDCPTRFVFTGSIAEHDLSVRPLAPIAADTLLMPEDDIARGNVDACRLFGQAAVHGFNYVWAVLPQLWGPGDRSGRLESWVDAIANDRPVMIRGLGHNAVPDGYVDTVAEALIHLASLKDGPAGRIPVAGLTSLSPVGFVDEAARALGTGSAAVFVDPSAIDRVFGPVGRSYRSPLIDFDLFMVLEVLEKTGFKSSCDWRKGVERTVTWLTDNRSLASGEIGLIRTLEAEVLCLTQKGQI